jgi:hypothetical protein
MGISSVVKFKFLNATPNRAPNRAPPSSVPWKHCKYSYLTALLKEYLFMYFSKEHLSPH